MCGLVGTYERRAAARRELLLTMAAELTHRGPDGVGLYLDGGFAMAGTRLAIVDLAGGQPPLSAGDGRYWIIQNGEIYNHPDLRLELERLGHRFETHCDTEVIAHAYAEWGPASLHRLNGDFAFAIWDRLEEELFLARDRFGVRPLFLLEHPGGLAFASEAKALLRHPAARRELDPGALADTFTTWSISPARSAFRRIRELAPAHYLVLRRDGTISETRWWDLDFHGGDARVSEREWAEQLLALLDDATRIRLRADVEVAAYLSGGLDSSAIVALAGRHVDRLVSFGLAFDEPDFDERLFQRQLAAELSTDLHQVVVDAPLIADNLPRAVELAERPTLRTAPVPLLVLSAAVRDAGLKVVLTGEGADELFAGYDLFREDRIRRFWARDPGSALRPLLLRRLYPYLPRELPHSPVLERFFARGLTDTHDPFYSHRIRFENTARCLRLLTPDVRAQAPDVVAELAAQLPPSFGEFTPLGRAQYLEIATFLEGYLLHAQGDRMLMGSSVEGRFPFLDHRVAELATRIPDRFRLRGLEEKHVLREAVRPLLPESIRRRPKRPYRAPIAPALFGPARPEYVPELLAAPALERAGIFDPAAVERLHAKAERTDGRGLAETEEMALVGVLSTMLLHDRLVAHPRAARTLVPTKTVVGATRDEATVAA